MLSSSNAMRHTLFTLSIGVIRVKEKQYGKRKRKIRLLLHDPVLCDLVQAFVS